MVAFFPWQESQWRRLSNAVFNSQLGHANLFTGRAGAGHHEFAVEFAKLLLCESPASDGGCNNCRSCKLFEAGNHPDYLLTAPEDEGKTIGVEQVRELASFYALKAHYGGRKVAVIAPAENMNRAASNALLKTLEEPPSGGAIILVTDRYDAISMTVRSRCQRTAFETINQPAALDWLADQLTEIDHSQDAAQLLDASCGAPLLALQRAEEGGRPIQEQIIECWAALISGRLNPLTASQTLEGLSVALLVNELAQLTYQLIVFKTELGTAGEVASSPDGNLKACINGLNLKDLYAILDVIFEAKRQVFSKTNPRDADLLDTIWLFLSEFAARRAT